MTDPKEIFERHWPPNVPREFWTDDHKYVAEVMFLKAWEYRTKRMDQLQEEVESLASSLLQALQGERNAIQGFKAGLSAAGKFNAEVWGFLYRNCDPMDMTSEDTEWYDSLRQRYDKG